MKAQNLCIAFLSALSASAAVSAAGVPPDYNPATARTVTAPADYRPGTALTPDARPGVPADYRAGRTTVDQYGIRTTVTPPAENTLTGLRPELKPQSDSLSMEEQIRLIERNEADIRAKARARDAAAREAADRAAQAENRRTSLKNQADDSSLAWQKKLNDARARHADEYVRAEIEGLKKGR